MVPKVMSIRGRHGGSMISGANNPRRGRAKRGNNRYMFLEVHIYLLICHFTKLVNYTYKKG